MNMEIGAEAALFPEKEYIKGSAVAVHGAQINFGDDLPPYLTYDICNPCKKIAESMKPPPRGIILYLENQSVCPFVPLFKNNGTEISSEGEAILLVFGKR